jgi:hypothetical protein
MLFNYLVGEVRQSYCHWNCSTTMLIMHLCRKGITPSGLGRVIEAYHRTVPTDATLGGGKQRGFCLLVTCPCVLKNCFDSGGRSR